MKQVFMAKDAGEAHLVVSLLESEGIAAAVQMCDFPYCDAGPFPTVWVLDDARAEEALSFIAKYEQSAEHRERKSRAWHCPSCGEKIEPQFTECWRCGANRPKGA